MRFLFAQNPWRGVLNYYFMNKEHQAHESIDM